MRFAAFSKSAGRNWGGGSHGGRANVVPSLRRKGRAFTYADVSGTENYSYFARTDDWGRSFQAVNNTRAPNLHVDDEDNLYADSLVLLSDAYPPAEANIKGEMGLGTKDRVLNKCGVLPIQKGRAMSKSTR